MAIHIPRRDRSPRKPACDAHRPPRRVPAGFMTEPAGFVPPPYPYDRLIGWPSSFALPGTVDLQSVRRATRLQAVLTALAPAI